MNFNKNKHKMYEFEIRNIGGSDVYYKRKIGDKFWLFSTKEEFELKQDQILRKIRRIQMNQPPEGEDEEEVVLTKKKPINSI